MKAECAYCRTEIEVPDIIDGEKTEEGIAVYCNEQCYRDDERFNAGLNYW